MPVHNSLSITKRTRPIPGAAPMRSSSTYRVNGVVLLDLGHPPRLSVRGLAFVAFLQVLEFSSHGGKAVRPLAVTLAGKAGQGEQHVHTVRIG